MSALAGIYNFDGAPVNPEIISALGSALDQWGPDGGNEICSGSLGMAYRAFHTSSGSRLENQPIISTSGQLLVWDGRLDNKSELLDEFLDSLRDDNTDAGLVCAGLTKHGVDFLTKIVGDFALAYYDSNSRSLILARDPFGTRTLYYHISPKRIIWCSTLDPLLDHARIQIEVDDEYVAEYLAFDLPHPSRTPYVGIKSVEPGHVIGVSNGQQKTRRFWQPDPGKETYHKSDEEYEEHFRHLFREVVNCRLLSDRPVWADMSGGLDSTSIVFMADQIFADGGKRGNQLSTVSYLYSEVDDSDEAKYIRYAEKKRGLPNLYIYSGDLYMKFKSPEEYFQSQPSNALCSNKLTDPIGNRMADAGARVRLSGLGGDQILWSVPDPSPHLTDLLRKFSVLQLGRQLVTWSSELKRPYLQILWQYALLPMLSGNLKVGEHNPITPPAWLHRTFANKVQLKERGIISDDHFEFRCPSKRIRFRHLQYIIHVSALGHYRNIVSTELAYPFMDRRLVEFALSLPFNQLLRPGETRSIQRRALRGIVPLKILQRYYKGGADHSLQKSFAREWPKIEPLLNKARVSARGYVNDASLRSALAQARHGSEVSMMHILQTLSLELWLRSLECRNLPILTRTAGSTIEVKNVNQIKLTQYT